MSPISRKCLHHGAPRRAGFVEMEEQAPTLCVLRLEIQKVEVIPSPPWFMKHDPSFSNALRRSRHKVAGLQGIFHHVHCKYALRQDLLVRKR